jgi:hypothetical protein
MGASFISTGMGHYCNPYSNRGVIQWYAMGQTLIEERHNPLKTNLL